MNKLEAICNEYLQNITITQEFIDYRNEFSSKFYTAGRDEKEMLISADCLIAEYELLRLGVAGPPTSFAHDVIIDGRLIDIKVVKGKWFTVKQRKLEWYVTCVANHSVDDFAFIAYKRAVTKPLVVGDTISLRFIKQIPAKEVLYNLKKSMYNGFYYPM